MTGRTKANYLCYAGLGAKNITDDIADAMADISAELESQGWILRTNGMEGSSEAFLEGITDPTTVELYLPWDGYNDFESPWDKPKAGAYEIGFLVHPNWGSLKESTRKANANLSHVIFGEDTYPGSAVDFMICYTENAECTGLTGQAIRVADYGLIPVFNLGLGIDFTFNQLERYLEKNHG